MRGGVAVGLTRMRKVYRIGTENNAGPAVDPNLFVRPQVEQSALETRGLLGKILGHFWIKLTVASSPPVATASPLGWNLTLFTSDSLPSNDWTHCPVLMSQISAVLSTLWKRTCWGCASFSDAYLPLRRKCCRSQMGPSRWTSRLRNVRENFVTAARIPRPKGRT